MLRIKLSLIFLLFSFSLQATCIQENLSDEQNFMACQQLANEGDAEANNALALMYEKGKGIGQDAMKAFRHYERSANLGNVSGQFNLGRLYDQGVNGSKNAYEAVNWLKKAASQQYIPAMNYLARIYFHGRGVNRSYEKSYQWITRSGGANTPEKHYYIGFLALKGHVINKNPNTANHHLLTAAEAGYADAQFQLGEMYRLGEYVEADDEIALSWLKKASLQKHEAAELSIKKIALKHEHEAYAKQQKMAAHNAPFIEIKVNEPSGSKVPEKTGTQNGNDGWGLHILLFFIVLIVAAILLLKNRSSVSRGMTEQEKEVINQALKSQLEKQQTDQPATTGTVEKKDDFYDNSFLEIAKQELEMNTVDKTLWDQVRSEANGDMAKAELLYLKKRVKALMESSR